MTKKWSSGNGLPPFDQVRLAPPFKTTDKIFCFDASAKRQEMIDMESIERVFRAVATKEGCIDSPVVYWWINKDRTGEAPRCVPIASLMPPLPPSRCAPRNVARF